MVGISHQSAPLELRERVAFNAEQARRAAAELRARRILEESVVVSTCNRSEIYGVASRMVDPAGEAIESFLAEFHHLRADEISPFEYRRRGPAVVRHLFRVASGLDSMLLGEAEILGQVRDAYTSALDNRTTGHVLNRLFQSALEVGKKVRSQTEISTRPMSVAFAGVKLAERIFGHLEHHTALIVGAGSVGEQVVEHMQRRGISRILVANRSLERARALATHVGGEAVPLEVLSTLLALPNIVVSSVSADQPVITRAMVERVMQLRHNRDLFFIDLGVPRNVEAGVADLYNVYLYNIDDLSEIVEQNRHAREREIPRAEAIVEEHVRRFEEWHAGAHAMELLALLRQKLEHEREAFLREHLGTLEHLTAEDRRRAERLSRELLEHVIQARDTTPDAAHDSRREVEPVAAARALVGLLREKS